MADLVRTYSLDELVDLGFGQRLLQAGERALSFPDNPKFPPRTPQKKQEDGIFGEAGEVVTELIAPGLTHHGDKYQDHEGTSRIGALTITGTIETKVLRERTEDQAQKAINRHLSHSGADWFILHYGDRNALTITPWAVARVMNRKLSLILL